MPMTLYDESNVEEVVRFSRGGYGELPNQVTVVYRDVVTDKDTPVTVQNLAAIQSQGFVIPISLDRPGYSNQALAARAASRELRVRSIPVGKGELRCLRAMWRTLPGEQFLLSWPKRKIASVIMRMTQIDAGTVDENIVTISFIEDVFNLPSSSYAVEEPWVFPVEFTVPYPATVWSVFEVSYWMLWASMDATRLTSIGDTGGYFSALVKAPNFAQQSFALYSRKGADPFSENFSNSGFHSGAELSADISASSTTLSIVGSNLSASTEIGTFGVIGEGVDAEWLKFISGSDFAGTLEVKRGMFDTTPRAHLSGSRVWKVSYGDARALVKYQHADVVEGAIFTSTSGQTLNASMAYDLLKSVTMNSRQIRPYAPGNFNINAVVRPANVPVNPFDVTWAHRSRLVFPSSLQTGTDVGPEVGVTYNIYVYDADQEILLSTTTGVTTTVLSMSPPYSANLRVEVEAERDTYVSWHKQFHTFLFTGLTWLDESGDYMTVEDDGSYFDQEW